MFRYKECTKLHLFTATGSAPQVRQFEWNFNIADLEKCFFHRKNNSTAAMVFYFWTDMSYMKHPKGRKGMCWKAFSGHISLLWSLAVILVLHFNDLYLTNKIPVFTFLCITYKMNEQRLGAWMTDDLCCWKCLHKYTNASLHKLKHIFTSSTNTSLHSISLDIYLPAE